MASSGLRLENLPLFVSDSTSVTPDSASPVSMRSEPRLSPMKILARQLAQSGNKEVFLETMQTKRSKEENTEVGGSSYLQDSYLSPPQKKNNSKRVPTPLFENPIKNVKVLMEKQERKEEKVEEKPIRRWFYACAVFFPCYFFSSFLCTFLYYLYTNSPQKVLSDARKSIYLSVSKFLWILFFVPNQIRFYISYFLERFFNVISCRGCTHDSVQTENYTENFTPLTYDAIAKFTSPPTAFLKRNSESDAESELNPSPWTDSSSKSDYYSLATRRLSSHSKYVYNSNDEDYCSMMRFIRDLFGYSKPKVPKIVKNSRSILSSINSTPVKSFPRSSY